MLYFHLLSKLFKKRCKSYLDRFRGKGAPKKDPGTLTIIKAQNKSHKTKWQLHFELSLAKTNAIFQKVIDNILVQRLCFCRIHHVGTFICQNITQPFTITEMAPQIILGRKLLPSPNS